MKSGFIEWLAPMLNRRLAVAVLLCSLLVAAVAEWRAHSTLIVEMRSRAGVDGEVFYAREGEAFDPLRRVSFEIVRDGRWNEYRIEVPGRAPIDKIRIDPGSRAGVVQIRHVSVKGASDTYSLRGSRLSQAIVARNQMEAGEGGDGVQSDFLSFNARSPDPFIELDVRSELASGTGLATRVVGYLIVGALIALCGLVVFSFGLPFGRALYAKLEGARWQMRLSSSLSDDGLLAIRTPALLVGLLFVSLSAGYVALGLHQSSIGVWEQIFPARDVPQLIELGTPKHVRSDEWNTQTPWVLNQVQEGTPSENPSIGGKKAPLLASVPASHVSSLAQVKFLGFHLLDIERGFSWWWAYKTIGLLMVAFWMLLILTRGDTLASLLGAAWLYGSSSVQWWLSSNLPEILIAFFLAVIGASYLLFAKRLGAIALGALLICYAATNLVLHLYPPFILPLAYLGLAIVFGSCAETGATDKMKYALRWRLVCGMVSAAIVAAFAATFFLDAGPTIDAMIGTVYPGHRIALSGDMPLSRVLYGYFEMFRMGEQRVPLPPTNASEASSFVLLFPILLLVAPLKILRSRTSSLLTTLFVYCMVLCLWIVVPLPGPAERAMQAIGWAWSPPARSTLGLGIASIILMIVLFARVRAGEMGLRAREARTMVPVVAAAFVLPLGYALHQMDPAFFSPTVIIAGAVSSALVVAGIAMGRSLPLLFGVSAIIAMPLMANPLTTGLSAVMEKPVLVAAKNASRENDKWAVIGAFVFSQGLKAQGLDVATGSQLVPDPDMATKLDRTGKYQNVWNRYAHVVFSSAPAIPSPAFELKSPDLYVVTLNVCGPEMKELGVTMLAYTEPVPQSDMRCLTRVDSPDDSGVKMFRRIEQTKLSQ